MLSFPAERPQILDATYGPVYVEVGTTFSLVCSFSGPLSVVQVWSLNGAPLSANTDPNLSITPDGTLTVAGPQEQYSGEYVCNVTTSYSFDFIRITVFVGSKYKIYAIDVYCVFKRVRYFRSIDDNYCMVHAHSLCCWRYHVLVTDNEMRYHKMVIVY